MHPMLIFTIWATLIFAEVVSLTHFQLYEKEEVIHPRGDGESFDLDQEPLITISSNDPALGQQSYIDTSEFAEGSCRKEVPTANLNASRYWSDLQSFIVAGSISMHLRLQQGFLKKALIPRRDLMFSVIPYPGVGTIVWTLQNGKALIQNSTDIDPVTKAMYTNRQTNDASNLLLATRFIENEHITVAETNNHFYTLLVRCINNEHRDYMVMAASPTLEPSTLKLVRRTITQLGFNPKLFRVSPDYG